MNYSRSAIKRWINTIINRELEHKPFIDRNKLKLEIQRDAIALFKTNAEFIDKENENDLSSSASSKKSPVMLLENCGFYFDDAELIKNIKKYIKIEATVIFDRQYNKGHFNNKYVERGIPLFECSTVQFCFNVPRLRDRTLLTEKREESKDDHSPYLYQDGKGELILNRAPEIYLGCEVYGSRLEWSKVWIPDIDFQPGMTFQDPEFKRLNYGFPKILELGKPYKFLAVSYGGIVKLQGINENGHAVTLYEGTLEQSKDEQSHNKCAPDITSGLGENDNSGKKIKSLPNDRSKPEIGG
ncbi:hypothetical protein PITCH_A990003 [uncultured Desulfobacterium sp.]|uniref:Uncharacterized protein n=1 Tax=uncultured Desulfobacterium sp. TaxID=201089 RepID=A0A445N4A8_9BACT|nr:hypothetical protein PITCH_A990003 [uncultured Desulfobacterium sp.]